jgi:hypothetical protein
MDGRDWMADVLGKTECWISDILRDGCRWRFLRRIFNLFIYTIKKFCLKKEMIMTKKGDIFFTDSDKTGPKIVKFLMQSPTVWHWALGKILGLFSPSLKAKFISPVRMYHAGMFVDEKTIIEQQWKIQHDEGDKIFGGKHAVWRYKHLTEGQADSLRILAEARLGTTYDIQLILGKTMTWLTGIKWFVRNVEAKNKDICITFVAYLYFEVVGYKWGRETWHEITTDLMDDWNMAHPDDWELVSIKE